MTALCPNYPKCTGTAVAPESRRLCGEALCADCLDAELDRTKKPWERSTWKGADMTAAEGPGRRAAKPSRTDGDVLAPGAVLPPGWPEVEGMVVRAHDGQLALCGATDVTNCWDWSGRAVSLEELTEFGQATMVADPRWYTPSAFRAFGADLTAVAVERLSGCDCDDVIRLTVEVERLRKMVDRAGRDPNQVIARLRETAATFPPDGSSVGGLLREAAEDVFHAHIVADAAVFDAVKMADSLRAQLNAALGEAMTCAAERDDALAEVARLSNPEGPRS